MSAKKRSGVSKDLLRRSPMLTSTRDCVYNTLISSDCLVINVSEPEQWHFTSQFLLPTFVEKMHQKNKCRVPVRYGTNSHQRWFYAIVDTPVDEPLSEAPMSVEGLLAEMSVKDEKLANKLRRRIVINQLHHKPRTLLVMHYRQRFARVFILDSTFAVDVMQETIVRASISNPPIATPQHIEAQLATGYTKASPMIVSCRAIMWRYMPDFIYKRIFAESVLLYNASVPGGGVSNDVEPSRISSMLPQTNVYYASMFGGDMVKSWDDETEAKDLLPEFAIESGADTSHATLHSVADSDATEMTLVGQADDCNALGETIASDLRRISTLEHEFADRLLSPGVERKLSERCGRVFAFVAAMCSSLSKYGCDNEWRQVDLFYLFQLGAAVCRDDERVSYKQFSYAAKLEEIQSKLAPLVASAVPFVHRIAELRYVFLIERRRRKKEEDRALGMLSMGLFQSVEMYQKASDLVDTTHLGKQIAMMQTRGSFAQRRFEMTMSSYDVVSRDELLAFMHRNVLCAHEKRFAESDFTVFIKVHHNDTNAASTFCKDDGVVSRSISNSGLQRHNYVSPMSVLSSVRNALPNARDGLDFSVIWTPLSHLKSDDERYAKVAKAVRTGSHANDLHVGDLDEAEYADEDNVSKRAHISNFDDEDGGDEYQTPRRAGRQKRQTAVNDLPVEPLADPAVYIAMKEQVWQTLKAARCSGVLMQRAKAWLTSAPSQRTFDAPLMAPMVAQQLALSTDVHVLCGALNSVAALIGASGSEWHHTSEYAQLYAVRAARLTLRLLYALNNTDANVAVNSALYPIACAHTDDKKRRYNSGVARLMRNHRTRPGHTRRRSIDPDTVYAALAVILNGASRTIVVPFDAVEELKDMCRNDARVLAYLNFKLIDDWHAQMERNYFVPEWYKTMMTLSGTRANRRNHKLLMSLSDPVFSWMNAEQKRQVVDRRELEFAALTTSERAEMRESLADTDDDSDDDSAFKITKKQRKASREAEEAADKLVYERARLLSRSSDDPSVYTHCQCGGASTEECGHMMRTLCDYIQPPDEEDVKPRGSLVLRCCVCALDTLPIPPHATLQTRFMTGACRWCRDRVCWRSTGRDTSIMRDNYHEIASPTLNPQAVSIYDIFEAVLQRAEAALFDLRPGLCTVLESFRFRMRQWVTLAPHPKSSLHSLPATAIDANLSTPIAKRLDECANLRLRRPLMSTAAMLASSVSFDELRDRLDEPDSIYAPKHTASRPEMVAGGLFFSAIETLSFTRHSDLLSVYGDGSSFFPENASSLPLLAQYLAPFKASIELIAYCDAFNSNYNYFPLCASALAESTAHGGTAMQSNVSNFAVPMQERLQNMLFDGWSMRPLACMVPLMQELLLMDWYDKPRVVARPLPLGKADEPPPQDNDSDDEGSVHWQNEHRK